MKGATRGRSEFSGAPEELRRQSVIHLGEGENVTAHSGTCGPWELLYKRVVLERPPVDPLGTIFLSLIVVL